MRKYPLGLCVPPFSGAMGNVQQEEYQCMRVVVLIDMQFQKKAIWMRWSRTSW